MKDMLIEIRFDYKGKQYGIAYKAHNTDELTILMENAAEKIERTMKAADELA
jgi:hypothetical protein